MVEGLYQGTGDLAPLAQIAALKRRYKYRLVVDESLAVGTLGPTGRGAAQHCGLQPQDVDIVCSSLGECAGAVLKDSAPACGMQPQDVWSCPCEAWGVASSQISPASRYYAWSTQRGLGHCAMLVVMSPGVQDGV